jgi:hypothetical protein
VKLSETVIYIIMMSMFLIRGPQEREARKTEVKDDSKVCGLSSRVESAKNKERMQDEGQVFQVCIHSVEIFVQ